MMSNKKPKLKTAKKKKKSKAKQFVTVSFKLSKQQSLALNQFCHDHQITVIHLIKSQLKKFMDYTPTEVPQVHPRQLGLWGDEE